MKLPILLSLVPLAMISVSVFGADDTYSGTIAASYAYNNVYTTYVSNSVLSDPVKHKNLNPFNDYVNMGGNCTNFLSQSMVGGFSSNTTPWGAFNKRNNYTADTTWFFKSDAQRGTAWTGAPHMYNYASRSSQTKGITFSNIATIKNGFKNQELSPLALGDLVSLNQYGKGFEHSMVVSEIATTTCSWWKLFCTPQRTVRVAYQNGGSNKPQQRNDITNTLQDKNGYVKVFRPTKYKR